jgi:hypothetical protein
MSCYGGKLVAEARGQFGNPEEGERLQLEAATEQRLVAPWLKTLICMWYWSIKWSHGSVSFEQIQLPIQTVYITTQWLDNITRAISVALSGHKNFRKCHSHNWFTETADAIICFGANYMPSSDHFQLPAQIYVLPTYVIHNYGRESFLLGVRFSQRWFWRFVVSDMTPCSLVKIKRPFGGIFFSILKVEELT